MFNKKAVLATGYSILTLVLSALPGQTAQKLNLFSFQNLDKVAHFGLYFIFSIVWFMYFFQKNTTNGAWKKALGLAIFFGSVMEIFQKTIFTDRSFEVADIISNTIGAIFGGMVCVILVKKGIIKHAGSEL